MLQMRKKNIFMRASATLLILVLISSCALAGLLARYTGKSDDTDTARVAAFNVSASGTANEIQVKPSKTGDDGVYEISVKNDSEVAVSYDIKLTTNTPLPSGISLKIGGTSPVLSADNKTYSFSNVGTLAPSSAQEMVRIAFEMDENVLLADKTGEKYELEADFAVSVIFTQID